MIRTQSNEEKFLNQLSHRNLSTTQESWNLSIESDFLCDWPVPCVKLDE